MTEIWKDIKGYKGFYQVSNLGNIKSLKRKVHRKATGDFFIEEKLLKQSNNSHGYLRVNLAKNGKNKRFLYID